MPSHCCVPGCTKRGYREEDGSKVSFFSFATDKTLRKQWTHAIRREEGKNFRITPTTKICYRHFKKEDMKKSLTGRMFLKPGVVPALFPWTRTSPRKRKSPTPRNINEESSSVINKNKSSGGCSFDVSNYQREDKRTKRQCKGSDDSNRTQSTQTEPEQFQITEKQSRRDELDREILLLQSQLEDIRRQNQQLQSRIFPNKTVVFLL